MNIIDIETHFLWLVGYSLLGWLYESALCSIREKRILNRGFLNGPYCPIKEEDSKKQTSQSSFQYQSCMEKGPESACSMDNP